MAQPGSEAPSSARVAQARLHGHVPRSQWLAPAALFGTLALSWLGLAGWVLGRLGDSLVAGLESASDPAAAMARLGDALAAGAAFAPVLVLLALVALAMQLVQVGPVWAGGVFAPRWRGGPPDTAGTRRARAAGALAVGLVGACVFLVLWPDALRVGLAPPERLAADAGALWLRALVWWAVCLFVLGSAEYAFARARWWSSLRLSRSRALELLREEQGSPQMRAERGRRARQDAPAHGRRGAGP